MRSAADTVVDNRDLRDTGHDQRSVRLFCFPYAGGSASIFAAWAGTLRPSIEVCAIEIPGRGSRSGEPLRRRIDALVADALDSIRPRLDRPYALLGHSMGAVLAFELARELEASGTPPLHLFVSGRRAPHLPPGPDFARPASTFDDDAFVTQLRRLNGTPSAVFEHPELVEYLLPILRADFEVCETYVHQPQPRLACGVTAYGGLRDDTPADDIRAWRETTDGTFSWRMFPGDHFFLNSDRVAVLMALGADLARVTGRVPSPSSGTRP